MKLSKKLLVKSLVFASLIGGGSYLVANNILNNNNINVVENEDAIQGDIVLPRIKHQNASSVVVDRALTLNDDITLRVRTTKPAEGFKRFVKFSFDVYEGSVTDANPIENGDGLIFSFDRVTPQYMNKSVTVDIYDVDAENNETHVETYTTSVAEYLEELLKTEGDNLDAYAHRAIAADLLRYGAAAQVYTNTDTENLVTNGLDLSAYLTYEKLEKPTDKLEITDSMWKGARLIFANKVGLSFAFLVEKDANIENYTAEFDYDGIVLNAADFIKVGNFTSDTHDCYEVRLMKISPAHFNNSISVTIKDNGVQVGSPLTYSVNSYVARTNDSSVLPLAKAAYCYGKSAVRYLERANGDLANKKITIKIGDEAKEYSANSLYDNNNLSYDIESQTFVVSVDESFTEKDVEISGYSGKVVFNVDKDIKINTLVLSSSNDYIIEGDGKLEITNKLISGYQEYYWESEWSNGWRYHYAPLKINANVLINRADNDETAVRATELKIGKDATLEITCTDTDVDNKQGFGIECKAFENYGSLKITNYYTGIHLNGSATIFNDINIENCLNGIIVCNYDLMVKGGKIDITTEETAIAVTNNDTQGGTFTLENGNVTLKTTGSKGVLYCPTLTVGADLGDGRFTNPTLSVSANGGEGISNRAFKILGQYEQGTNKAEYNFISGTTTIDQAKIGEHAGLSLYKINEGVNDATVHQNATLNVSGFAKNVFGWDRYTRFISYGNTNLTNSSQHGIMGTDLYVRGGKTYIQSNSVGAEGLTKLEVDGGFLHIASNSHMVWDYIDSAIEFNFISGKALFEKLGNGSAAGISSNDYSKFNISEGFIMGFKNCTISIHHDGAGVSFKEDVNATLYTYNSGTTWGITNADKLSINFASKNEEEFNSLFN